MRLSLHNWFMLFLVLCRCLGVPDSFGNAPVDFNRPAEAEDSLQILFNKLNSSSDASERVIINDKIAGLFKNILEQNEYFDHPFDSLTSLGRIYSTDNRLRIFTWNYSDSPAENRYFGFLQFRENAEADIAVYFLDHKEAKKNHENQVYHPENWYGALYYQVHDVHYAGNTYYTLIGFDFNNIFTNIKVIDILSFVEGKPVFGSPVFHFKGEIKNRMIFEYSSKVVMFLRYIPEVDMIIYDHLSPGSPNLQEHYRYYGPDLSYDGLRFEKGKWLHFSDINWK